jgi:hypothetical protein
MFSKYCSFLLLCAPYSFNVYMFLISSIFVIWYIIMDLF